MAALNWIDYNYLDREEHVRNLFKCIRFSLMSMEEIIACYHPPILTGLMEIQDVKKTLLGATCYITAKSLGQEGLFLEVESKPRAFLFGGEAFTLWDVSLCDPDKYEIIKEEKAATKIQAFYRGYTTRKNLQAELEIANYAATVIQSIFRGYCVRKTVKFTKSVMKSEGKSSKHFLLRKDSKSGLLKAYSKRTFEIFEPASEIEKPSLLYVMGAFDSAKKSEGNSIFIFNTMDRHWTMISSCPVQRHDARMVSLDGHLYIIGGFNPLDRTGLKPLKECHRLHLDSKEWHELHPMNVARSCHAAAVFNEMILVIGGKDETNKILSSIERYDASSEKWENFSPSLPEPRMAMGYTIHKRMLWIAGGLTLNKNDICTMDSVWCLDNKTCRWTKKINLQQAVAFPTLFSGGEHLFCVGGVIRPLSHDGEELESSDKIYILERNRWIEQTSMPIQCHRVIGCNIGKNIFVLVGFSSHTKSRIEQPFYLAIEDQKVENLEKLPSKAEGFIIEATPALQ